MTVGQRHHFGHSVQALVVMLADWCISSGGCLCAGPNKLSSQCWHSSSMTRILTGCHTALSLNLHATKHCYSILMPYMQVSSVTAGIPSASVAQVLVALAAYLADSPHLEFLLGWLRDVCVKHGKTLQNEKAAAVMPAFRSLQRVLGKTHEDLAAASDSNLYTLQYLCVAGQNAARMK